MQSGAARTQSITDPQTIQRFWSHVNKNGPVHPVLGTQCWEWTGCVDGFGYGRMHAAGGQRRAHRISWFLEHGVWPTLNCLHHCDNPRCVRTSHLYDGTHKQNSEDRVQRQRTARGSKNGQSKLLTADVKQIRELYAAGRTQQSLATQFGVNYSVVSRAINAKTWRHA